VAVITMGFGATIADELGTTANSNAYISGDDAQTLAQVRTAAQLWATDLDGLTAGQLTSLRVSIHPALPGGIKATPAAGSRVEATAVINLRAGASGHRFGTVIPAIKDALIVAGKLNLADIAITTFVGLLQGAVLAGTYTTPAGNALGVVVDAILSFRKRRKQLARSSFEL
jgi:hypothetical protein